MLDKLYCISAEMHNQQGVFLVRTKEDSLLRWCYLYVGSQSIQIFKALVNFLPLSLCLWDYGRIIESGDGENPPRDIFAQISNGDFSSKPLDSNSEIFCIVSENDSGREFYTYLDVPYYLIEKFKLKCKDKQEMELTHYGKILCSGWGRPSEEVIAMMKNQYGVDTPILETV